MGHHSQECKLQISTKAEHASRYHACYNVFLVQLSGAISRLRLELPRTFSLCPIHVFCNTKLSEKFHSASIYSCTKSSAVAERPGDALMCH